MIDCSLSPIALSEYVSCQVNAFFPDPEKVAASEVAPYVEAALGRIDHCFQHLISPRYQKDGRSRFDHLYSDQYLMFLWFLSSEVWNRGANRRVATKVYLLNKLLHGFDCMFDTLLPDVFVIIHGLGVVLGKARYNDFLVVYQGTVIGSNHGAYPVLGEGVGLGAGSGIVGKCLVGDNVSIGIGTYIVDRSLPAGSVSYRDVEGKLITRPAKRTLASEYFLPEFLPSVAMRPAHVAEGPEPLDQNRPEPEAALE